MLEEPRNLRADDAAEHQDGHAHAVLAKADTFFEVGDADVRRADGFKLLRDLDEPVAVRVGLEDRHDTRRGDVRREHPVVRREDVEIDLEIRRP